MGHGYVWLVLTGAAGIVIPILLIELYAASKGKNPRLWGWRALWFGPSIAAILLATSKSGERQFRKCPECNMPARVTEAVCQFCHKALPFA
ncbi:MAG TPA: hypothetical protein VFY29_17545 [Terriglobia bacterium]|nr:hypothetical protein [Terriglobia bacterium]